MEERKAHTARLNGPVFPEQVGGDIPLAELSGLAHKVRRNLQDYGWRTTLQKVLAYSIRSVYFRQVYRIYRINLAETKPPVNDDARHFTFKMLATQNVDMIAQVESIAEWLQGKLKDAIAAGHPCLVALDGDQVAGFNLINTNRATLVLVNLEKELRTGHAWSEHIAVKKAYRRKGLGTELRYRIFQEQETRVPPIIWRNASIQQWFPQLGPIRGISGSRRYPLQQILLF